MRILLLAATMLAVTLGSAQARDTEHRLPIAEAMADAEARKNLGNDITFYFGTQPHPAVAKTFGEYTTNKKTNAFNKTDEVACRWAMLSALIQLRDRARQLGANGVVNIVSYYKKNIQSSATEYVCHAGNVVAGVALKGKFVSFR